MVYKIHFREDCTLDLFTMQGLEGGIGIFVSENLKNKIQEAGCKGILFSKT